MLPPFSASRRSCNQAIMRSGLRPRPRLRPWKPHPAHRASQWQRLRRRGAGVRPVPRRPTGRLAKGSLRCESFVPCRSLTVVVLVPFAQSCGHAFSIHDHRSHAKPHGQPLADASFFRPVPPQPDQYGSHRACPVSWRSPMTAPNRAALNAGPPLDSRSSPASLRASRVARSMPTRRISATIPRPRYFRKIVLQRPRFDGDPCGRPCLRPRRRLRPGKYRGMFLLARLPLVAPIPVKPMTSAPY